MKKKAVKEDSDEFEADEPEEFDESGSDWDPEEGEAAGAPTKKRKGRAKAAPKKAAPTKKKKTEKKPPSDEEDEDEEDEDEEEDEEGEESDSEDAPGNGTFVVLKTDFKTGGNHPLWKIDGKALLQKFIPYEEDGKTLYKNTSTYSGWTQSNRNQYAPAPVKFVVQSKKEVVIEFLRDDVNLDAEAAGAPAKA